jgi:hypothetical protein
LLSEIINKKQKNMEITENTSPSVTVVDATPNIAKAFVPNDDSTPKTKSDEDTVAKRGVGRPVTKVTLKRVVLLNGKPVGRGRPSKDGKSERTVVFIPVNETYDPAVHGTGKKYNVGMAQYKLPIKRIDIAKYKKLMATTTSPIVPVDTTVVTT